ncbi:PREDICTED: uncharacterized protein LOC109353987 [Lupinus angustifolius]|uniref:uncharacterized protein LOC109353987 n=1 Tax=Lupinus angustifolius TaxID=3871 RepID=UPI00092F9C6F|nr:PREDICTED: uncharacterized protein LOC109353987 [Lupinus angustifolius]
MRSINSKTTYFTFIVIVLVAVHAEGRALGISATELVSDGVNDIQSENSHLHLKGSEPCENICEQMYGFLPCSTNILGHLFLILVYEYLLFHGESYMAAGSEKIFEILGPGIFGSSAFDLLRALPESLILLVTGLNSDKKSAQEYASSGVGLLAGSSILLLTVVWGTCVIIGSQNLNDDHNPSGSNRSKLSIKESLTGSGLTMDIDTVNMSRIMVFSIIPLLIMQIPTLFNLSSTPRAVTLMVSLIIAVIFLISYFVYQVFEPHIEKRRLEYIKHDHLILRIFQHVNKQTLQKILAEDGSANVAAINGLYHEISGGEDLLASDIKEMLLQNKENVVNIKEEQIADLLRIFDRNGDQVISREEFVDGLTNYINQTKRALEKKYIAKESMNKLYKSFIKPWIEHTRRELKLKGHIISQVLNHAQTDRVGSLCKDDGTPDEDAIRRLFQQVDSDGDGHASKSELKILVKDINLGEVADSDEAVAKIIHELDLNGDDEISENEFVEVFTNWINRNSSKAPHLVPMPHENQAWEEVETVVEDKRIKGIKAWLGAIGYVILGITMLSLLAEPLVHNVQNFSEKAGISSFFISFIIVPIATNFREATTAIREASQKKRGNTSQTIYEIYESVFMNNILGFVVISSLIYMRNITWEFSADVLIVAIVCVVMGVSVSFRSTFPLWTSFPAYAMYLLSLVLIFVLKDILHYV